MTDGRTYRHGWNEKINNLLHVSRRRDRNINISRIVQKDRNMDRERERKRGKKIIKN